MLLKSFKIFVPVLGVAALVFALTEAMGREKTGIRQPVQFNHKLHTEEWELDCDTCHRFVMEAEFAGRPGLEICTVCHEEPLTENPEELILGEYIRDDREIPWRRLYDVPSHVYYSHRRHVVVAGIECTECHGEIGVSTSPPEAPLNKLTMEFCLNCHEKQSVTTDCNACHR